MRIRYFKIIQELFENLKSPTNLNSVSKSYILILNPKIYIIQQIFRKGLRIGYDVTLKMYGLCNCETESLLCFCYSSAQCPKYTQN